MKVRKGFVSNSSSSSFIVSKGGRYKNSLQLAEHMLTIRNADYDSWEDTELEKIRRSRERQLNQDISVTFPSCNYDTFITVKPDRFLVSTCNNTDWDDVQDVLSTGGGHDDGDFGDEESQTMYWHMKHGLFAKSLTWDQIRQLRDKGVVPDDYCTKKGHCKSWIEMENGEVVCPSCWLEEHPNTDMFLDQKIIRVKPSYTLPKRIKLR